MANFEVALEKVGVDYSCIERAAFPRWAGWQLIDAPAGIDSVALEAEVKSLYLKEFWLRAGCNWLPQALAENVFDHAIITDAETAVRALQRVTACDRVDGACGRETIDAALESLNEVPENTLVQLYRFERIKNYMRTGKPKTTLARVVVNDE